jgi:hypothetical protein
MKKLIVFGFILFHTVAVTAQILSFETVGNIELCDFCDGSELCMAKCNACKGQFSADFLRLFRYETKRLGEIQYGNLSEEEEQQQMRNLKAYINGEINRIKGHIQFCVQSKMREEEAAQRTASIAEQRAQESNRITYVPRSVTEGVKMGMMEGISQAGDNAANTLAQRNEDNIRRGEVAEREVAYWSRQENAAERKKEDLYDAAKMDIAYKNNDQQPVGLKSNLEAQMANSQSKIDEKQQECDEKTKAAQTANEVMKNMLNN